MADDFGDVITSRRGANMGGGENKQSSFDE
jgi:hypothetical protein